MEAIKVSSLSFKYPKADEYALKEIDFSVGEGEFVVLCGESGSGKTTLQSLLKPFLAPKGEKSGEILVFGKSVEEYSAAEGAKTVGFIQQNVEYQLVTHSVRSELAFALQNLGFSNSEITSRIAESAEFFSLSSILDERVDSLSGGQKQLLTLAAQCAVHPRLLILDEPTSQLDPISAEKLLGVLRKLSDEFSLTVFISEQRLQNVIPLADRLICVEKGRIIFNDRPKKLSSFSPKSEFLLSAMPPQTRICLSLGAETAPLTIREGRAFLASLVPEAKEKALIERSRAVPDSETAVRAKSLYYSYDAVNYVLRDFSLEVKKGRIFALLGENGSGKTTALKLLCGILDAKKGKLEIAGVSAKKKKRGFENAAYLPQKCEALFAGPTIFDDLYSFASSLPLSKDEIKKRIDEVSSFFGIEEILERHPYDVSGGEMQRSALAMLLLKEPDILFLDEPTKGMDSLFKKRFGETLRELAKKGKTVFMVCHDTEFCASFADECAMLFDGRVISESDSRSFFLSNYFYTTAARKMSVDVFENAVTEEEVLALCEKNL